MPRRTRNNRPEFWDQRRYLPSVNDGPRLLWLGMQPFADDYGVIVNNPRTILGDVFPYDHEKTESMIAGWITNLEFAELVMCFQYEETSYLAFTTWEVDQTAGLKYRHKGPHIKPDDLKRILADRQPLLFKPEPSPQQKKEGDAKERDGIFRDIQGKIS